MEPLILHIINFFLNKSTNLLIFLIYDHFQANNYDKSIGIDNYII